MAGQVDAGSSMVPRLGFLAVRRLGSLKSAADGGPAPLTSPAARLLEESSGFGSLKVGSGRSMVGRATV
jgi:hypothetical protein